MMKRLISFMCCLVPFGAGAAIIPGDDAQQPLPGTSFDAGYALNTTAADGTQNTYVIKSGNGIVAGSGGITVEQDVYIGTDSGTPQDGGYVYAETGIDKPYTIRTDGNISVGGNLDVASGYVLGIDAQSVGGKIATASFGGINADGALTIQNVGALTVDGAVQSADKLSMTADSINAGAINTGDNATLTTTGLMKIAQLVADGSATTTTTIKAGSIESNGKIQNLAGEMEITSDGAINAGALENSGELMDITKAGVITVAGTMKNDKDLVGDSSAGVLRMNNVASLLVNGGDNLNASFVNNGDVDITVAGETHFEYGFNLRGMNKASTFELTTGTLTFGADMNADAWENTFTNHLNSFLLTVNSGTLDIKGGVTNGLAATATTDAVATSNMTMDVASISVAESVLNQGNKLEILAKNTDSSINITGDVIGNAGSTTNLISAGKLIVSGDVSNNGQMVLNGNDVQLQDVSNNGVANSLEISSYTDRSGKIVIAGNLTNTLGTTVVEAKDINIAGTLTNNSGTTTVRGSDSGGDALVVGAIDVKGGTVNLNALAGTAAITNGITVNGGTFNVGADINTMTTGGNVYVAGDVLVSGAAAAAGDMNINTSGTPGFTLKSNTGYIKVDGSIKAIDNILARNAAFDADLIEVGADIVAQNKGKLAFGSAGSTQLSATGVASATNGGIIEIYSGATTVAALENTNNTASGAGKFIVHGNQLVAKTGAINIDGGLRFDGTDNDTGMTVNGTSNLTLKTSVLNKDINIVADSTDPDNVGISVATGNTLTINSAHDATVSGKVNAAGTLNVIAVNKADFDAKITSGGVLDVKAATIEYADIENSGTASLIARDSNDIAGNIDGGGIINRGNLTLNGNRLTLGGLSSSAGVFDVIGNSLSASSISVSGGKMNLAVPDVNVGGRVYVAGNVYHGSAPAEMLNIMQDGAELTANNLQIDGKLNAASHTVNYVVANAMTIKGDVDVATGAAVVADAGTISGANINNSGTLTLNARNGITGAIVANNGTLTLNSGNGYSELTSFANNATGTATLSGVGMKLPVQAVQNTTNGFFTTPGVLYQNQNAAQISAGDVNVVSNNYALSALKVDVAGINQQSGRLVLNTSDITVGGNIAARDLRIAANPKTNWLNATVDGSVSGGVQFIGLGHMDITGNYVFNDNSMIHAAILPYGTVTDANTTPYNYWADVSLVEDNTLGQITNRPDAKPLISVGGRFVSEVAILGTGSAGVALKPGQIGIDVFDIVNPGTAIWLLHADDGLTDLATKIRNLNVNFCNADGSLCFNYFDAIRLDNTSGTADGTPAYISVRDSAHDGNADSLYIVFDPRFGGPVEVFKIQPIVGREVPHTKGEYVSAGALDDMIAGQLLRGKFYNRTPIEAIPLVFRGTNMENVAVELYKRMEQYNLERDGNPLARFSRLMQPREIEQVVGSIALNEHTSFRSFEDHMFDEVIWNRHRNLQKAWADFDFGMFSQDVSDGKTVDGNRFSITGGYDWQYSPTLILGLMGRVSHMSADNSDDMDLGYRPGEFIAGHVSMDVADTNIGIGGYMIQTLGLKSRIYGNAFLDAHILDVSRKQNYVGSISGIGSAFSLISEWGLMHDWLNQYVVGNLYARAGYNTGFSLTEKVGGDEYMHLESDGYMIFTPGYSLTAQKRIYPSSWFQIRPYASIGVEYDVLGVPDFAKYKFEAANSYTKYNVDINPLWANIGAGVELISARGVQVGLDYRYQYNTDIQLHNLKLSGSYRF